MRKLSQKEKELLDSSIEDIIKRTYAMSFSVIWNYIEQTLPIEARKEGFLYVFEILWEQSKVTIAWEYYLLPLPIEEVIKIFRDNWPSEEEFDEDQFSTVKPYKIFGKKGLYSHYWTPGELFWIGAIADPEEKLRGVPIFSGVPEKAVKRLAFKWMQEIGAKKFPEPVTVSNYILELIWETGTKESPKPIVSKGIRYAYKNTKTNASVTLRPEFEGANSKGARWVIAINKHPAFEQGGKIDKAEFKFR